MKHLKLIIAICMAIGIVLGSIAGGYYWGKSPTNPGPIVITETTVETVYETVEVPVEVKVIETVVYTEYVDRLVEVPVEVTREIIDWNSEKELKAFLESDNTDEVLKLVASDNGTVEINNQCEDRALQLIKNAQIAGKRLFFVPLHREEYAKWYDETIEEGHYHAVAGAIIGNGFYYIEPSDDRYWLALYLD